MESSPRDALLAEILGDVGRLQDQVRQLSNDLPSLQDTLCKALDSKAGNLLSLVDSLDITFLKLGSLIDVHVAAAVEHALLATKTNSRVDSNCVSEYKYHPAMWYFAIAGWIAAATAILIALKSHG